MVCGRHEPEDLLRIFHANIRNRQVGQLCLADDGGGARSYGVGDEAMAVSGLAGPRHEYPARPHILAGFDDRRLDVRRQIAASRNDLPGRDRGDELVKRRHVLR